MEQNIVIAIDHSAEAEQAVKCELRDVCVKVDLQYGAGEHHRCNARKQASNQFSRLGPYNYK